MANVIDLAARRERILLFENPAPETQKDLWICLHTHGSISDRHRISAQSADQAQQGAADALGFPIEWARAGEASFDGSRA